MILNYVNLFSKNLYYKNFLIFFYLVHALSPVLLAGGSGAQGAWELSAQDTWEPKRPGNSVLPHFPRTIFPGALYGPPRRPLKGYPRSSQNPSRPPQRLPKDFRILQEAIGSSFESSPRRLPNRSQDSGKGPGNLGGSELGAWDFLRTQNREDLGAQKASQPRRCTNEPGGQETWGSRSLGNATDSGGLACGSPGDVPRRAGNAGVRECRGAGNRKTWKPRKPASPVAPSWAPIQQELRLFTKAFASIEMTAILFRLWGASL